MCNTVVVVVILSGHMASWGFTTSLSPRPVCCMLSREQEQQPFLHRFCSLFFRVKGKVIPLQAFGVLVG